jgi:NAD-dependent dihydropyrimidine dehydrogenase PreA subunit
VGESVLNKWNCHAPDQGWSDELSEEGVPMVSYSRENLPSIDPFDIGSEKTLPTGFLNEAELTAFSLLIHHRRSLPIYFGDCWRCYLCMFECFDFFDMVDHILGAHEPEPFNEADEAELEEWGFLEPD